MCVCVFRRNTLLAIHSCNTPFNPLLPLFLCPALRERFQMQPISYGSMAFTKSISIV